MGEYIFLFLRMPTGLTAYLQMARSRRNLNDSRPQSPSDDDSSDEKDVPRGRAGKQSQPDKMEMGA